MRHVRVGIPLSFVGLGALAACSASDAVRPREDEVVTGPTRPLAGAPVGQRIAADLELLQKIVGELRRQRRELSHPRPDNAFVADRNRTLDEVLVKLSRLNAFLAAARAKGLLGGSRAEDRPQRCADQTAGDECEANSGGTQATPESDVVARSQSSQPDSLAYLVLIPSGTLAGMSSLVSYINITAQSVQHRHRVWVGANNPTTLVVDKPSTPSEAAWDAFRNLYSSIEHFQQCGYTSGQGDVTVTWIGGLQPTTYSDTDYQSGSQCKPPKPRFSASTSQQTSGNGGALRITAGHPVSLQNTTTDYGYPAASAGDMEWWFDQTQLGTGASHTFTPGYGSHTVWVSLTNSTGQGETSMSLEVVPPDEAESCDDPITDVVEECGDGGGTGSYGVGGSTSSGTQQCWVNDWYTWNETLGQYEFWYTEVVYCWYNQA